MYNQLVSTNTENAVPNILGSEPTSGLQINSNYKGSLSTKDLQEIQKKYTEYQQLEKETGVPWKVIAALDIAGGWKVSAKTAAKEIQKACKENGVAMTPSTSRSQLMDMLNGAKKNMEAGSWKSHLLDVSKVFYDDIGRAFSK